MSRPSDERLIAYLDGELDASESAEIALWLERDAGLRDRAAQLSESAALLRTAFDEVLHEPVPERLLAAARGESAAVVDLAAVRRSRWTRFVTARQNWIGMAAAASLACLLIGGGVGYFASDAGIGRTETANVNQPANTWLDNIAGYHKLYITASPGDIARFDVPAGQKLPQNTPLPNLKPWGLEFQGVRFLIIEGRPATQLFYTTDNKALGPITVVIASTNKPDIATKFDHRDDLNLLYWRHHGHAYAIVGTASINYLWNIHNDIAYQLDTI
jgi:anti-sigma factor RsiW